NLDADFAARGEHRRAFAHGDGLSVDREMDGARGGAPRAIGGDRGALELDERRCYGAHMRSGVIPRLPPAVIPSRRRGIWHLDRGTSLIHIREIPRFARDD